MKQAIVSDSQLAHQVAVAVSGAFPVIIGEQITKIIPAMGKNPEMLQIGIQTGKKRIYVPVIGLHDRYAGTLLLQDGDKWYLDPTNLSLTCAGKDWELVPNGVSTAPEEPKKN